MERRFDRFYTGDPMPDDTVATTAQTQAALDIALGPKPEIKFSEAVADIETATVAFLQVFKAKLDTANEHLTLALALLEKSQPHRSLSESESSDWKHARLLLACMTTPMDPTNTN